MLLQSQQDEIELLPALPKAWAEGSIKGLKARGGFEVSMSWQQQQLQFAVIKSLTGANCSVLSKKPLKIAGSDAVSKKIADGYRLSFPTLKGKTYHLTSL